MIASAHSNDTGMWPGQSPEKGQRRRISRTYNVPILCTGNDVPKIIINGTINLFLKTAMSFLLISNRNNFRVLFDKKLLPYILLKIYIYFSVEIGQPREPALCQLYRRIFVPYT